MFFSVIEKDLVDVEPSDVVAFTARHREPRNGPNVARIEDGESGLSARTIRRRLAVCGET